MQRINIGIDDYSIGSSLNLNLGKYIRSNRKHRPNRHRQRQRQTPRRLRRGNLPLQRRDTRRDLFHQIRREADILPCPLLRDARLESLALHQVVLPLPEQARVFDQEGPPLHDGRVLPGLEGGPCGVGGEVGGGAVGGFEKVDGAVLLEAVDGKLLGGRRCGGFAVD